MIFKNYCFDFISDFFFSFVFSFFSFPGKLISFRVQSHKEKNFEITKMDGKEETINIYVYIQELKSRGRLED